MTSLFQTATGSWHIPSILMAASWLIGTLVAGGFMLANLRVNRDDRLAAFQAQQQATIKITQLEKVTKPRRLTSEQKETIVGRLKDVQQKQRVFIAASVLDAEAIAFGEDIESVLIAAGFEVRFPKGMQADSMFAVGPPGLHIVVKDPKTPNPVAARIQRSFMDSGIEMPGLTAGDPQFDTNRVEIAIGQK